ncbi:MAG: hypothetical protein ABIU63_10625 [Chitinophagaceae bacterium]
MTTNKNAAAIIYTKESLQQEQRRLKQVIKQQETDLRQRVQKLPGELVYAGVDAVLPNVLTGKISDKILGAGRNFINNSIVRKTAGNTSRLVTAAKQAGIFTLVKLGYNIFIRKRFRR